ncbi:unnamed protein product [Trichobilharzia regenti]|nr:unnamed protein product [Trichobilharzia regenti]
MVKTDSSTVLAESNAVSTSFDVKSRIYNQGNNTPITWIDDYSNVNSQPYNDLKTKYCDLITHYLQQASSGETDGSTCPSVSFTPVSVIQPDGSVVRAVQGDAVINVPTTAGSQLTSSQLYSLLVQGYNRTTSPSSIRLDGLQAQRKYRSFCKDLIGLKRRNLIGLKKEFEGI